MLIYILAFFPQSEDTQKLQLIPLKKLRPSVTGADASSPLLDEDATDSKQTNDASLHHNINNNNEKKAKSSPPRTPQPSPNKKAAKALNKKQKEKSNSKQQKSAKNKKKPSTAEKSTEVVASLDKEEEPVEVDLQLTGVQFAFEHPGLDENKSQAAAFPRKRSADDGTYDVLPLIRIDEYDEDEHLAQMDLVRLRHSSEPPPKTDSHPPLLRITGFGRSADSIPFIDESPRKICNYHEERFITIQPQNIGSVQTQQQQQLSSSLVLLPSFKPPPTAPIAVSTADQLPVLVEPYKDSLEVTRLEAHPLVGVEVEHHFRIVLRVDAKLCQMCHEFLEQDTTAATVVRCLTCGLVCHELCAANKVSFELNCLS